MPIRLTAAPDDDGRRLDRILRKALPGLPLSAIHRLLRKGGVLADGIPSEGGRRIRAGEVIEIPVPEIDAEPDIKKTALPASEKETIPRKTPKILFEGEGLLVINKEAGREVHGEGSLENDVRFYLKDRIPPSLSFRPGPLHRLDRPTSGIIVFSTNIEGARHFSGLLREGRVRKRYIAITDGLIEKKEIWEDLLSRDKSAKKTFVSASGVMALSEVTPLACTGECSLISVEIKTGRTHQIRSQAAGRGRPLLGDKKYGSRVPPKNRAGFFLHAAEIEFISPLGNRLCIKAPLPGNFRRELIDLFGRDAVQLLELP